LYPRAKFVDGLTIIEKLGHSKRMQLQRKAWIEEGKPRPSIEDEDLDYDEPQTGTPQPDAENGGEIVRFGSESSRASREPDVMLDGVDEKGGEGQKKPAGAPPEQLDDGEPDEDELDALLAEEPTRAGAPSRDKDHSAPPMTESAVKPSFDDDEEAMREMDELW
jgi:replication fork protection complex subunit Csm3/Swi3